jgi:hypothetical protein
MRDPANTGCRTVLKSLWKAFHKKEPALLTRENAVHATYCEFWALLLIGGVTPDLQILFRNRR